MNRFAKMISILLLVLFFAASCESYGVLGWSGVSGADATQEIRDSYYEGSILWWALWSGTYSQTYHRNLSGSTYLGATVVFGEVIIGVSGIDEGSHYTRESVDSCKETVKAFATLGLDLVGGLSCRLQTVPGLVQLGETGKKQYMFINIGPIGL